MSPIKPNAARAVFFAWSPVLITMVLIFVFSAQPKHGPPAGTQGVYFSGSIPIFQGNWDAIVKKSSHVAGYGLLALLCWRALRVHAVAPREAAALAVLIAVSFGLTDELHQSFVAGRHSSVLDIGFDYAGAVAAVLLARAVSERKISPWPPKTNSPRREGRV